MADREVEVEEPQAGDREEKGIEGKELEGSYTIASFFLPNINGYRDISYVFIIVHLFIGEKSRSGSHKSASRKPTSPETHSPDRSGSNMSLSSKEE